MICIREHFKEVFLLSLQTTKNIALFFTAHIILLFQHTFDSIMDTLLLGQFFKLAIDKLTYEFDFTFFLFNFINYVLLET